MNQRPSPKILITRPEDKAAALKRDLEARGYATIVEPLLTIETLGPLSALAGDVQALALTSANAVPALSDEAKRLPIFTVGKATSAAALDAGCDRVIAGDGDGADLAALIGERCRPESGAVLHVGGEIVREDPQRRLAEMGFDVRREVVYRAMPKSGFTPSLTGAWQAREIAAVLLFSPRSAEILVRLLIQHGLDGHVDRTAAICVSEATATPCRTLDWRSLHLAARPNREALIRALEGSIRIC